MHTASDLWSAFNELFLDAAPAVALAALAVSWILRKKKLDREEREVRARIEKYKE